MSKKKKTKITSDERIRRARDRRFRQSINTIFINSGFSQIKTRDSTIDIAGKKGDIDALFFFKNIVVLSEDTCTKPKGLRDHINKTGIFYSHLSKNKDRLLDFLKEKYPEFKEKVGDNYHNDEIEIRFIYCSLESANAEHFSPHPVLRYLSHTSIKYFLALGRTIHRSSRYELIKFLGIRLEDMEPRAAGIESTYDGFVLPEAPSGFPKNHQVVTFYIDPGTLIERSYVLRKDSWRDSESLYQRMLIKSKIKNMRAYLAGSERVFINNIVASLPPSVKFEDQDGCAVSKVDIKRMRSLKIRLPREFNSIGIIDGQHRLFCYHEGLDKFEDKISKRREKQQLLVTGILFPPSTNDSQKIKFEAQLFLEINDKQSRARASLKQSIETILTPFSGTALAKSVILAMARSGPLSGFLEDHFFGDGAIKTSSIVSYGLKNIVDVSERNRSGSFFKIWSRENNSSVFSDEDFEGREQYVSYCAHQLNIMISGFKEAVPNDMWTTKRNVSRVLSTTTINGFIFCMRKLIEHDLVGDFEFYKEGFGKLNLDFRPAKFPYKSSHWRKLGDLLFERCFRP